MGGQFQTYLLFHLSLKKEDKATSSLFFSSSAWNKSGFWDTASLHAPQDINYEFDYKFDIRLLLNPVSKLLIAARKPKTTLIKN